MILGFVKGKTGKAVSSSGPKKNTIEPQTARKEDYENMANPAKSERKV